MPFLEEFIKKVANNHLFKGIWLFSKIVPTVTLNCFLQSLHFQTPFLTGLLEFSLACRVRALQCFRSVDTLCRKAT